MDFELTDDQQTLRDSVRSVLDQECPPALVRHAHEGTAPEEVSALWRKMVQLDWPALAVPEELGGLGLGFVELGLAVEELGRAAAPGPFMATVTQFEPIVRHAGSAEQQKSLLGPVLAEGATGTLALAEPAGRWELEGLHTTARRDGASWILDGRKSFVMDGATADTIAVVARDEAAPASVGVFAVPGSSLVPLPSRVIDPSQPLAEVGLDGVHVQPDAVLVEPGDPRASAAVTSALEEATAALALSIVGTCRVIFERTLQYVKDREQYGRPIGSFQAIKHRIVDMYLLLERASALASFAALTIAEDDDRREIAVSMAKTAAGDCQRLLVKEGLQLHGGIGFMWEQDLHLFLKRAQSSDVLLGSGGVHRAAVARKLGIGAKVGS
jgi:alkylation response protein AidB-like acyl-CoA dehydrogenase